MRLDPAVYVVPTDRPEADGTLAWDSTTLVLVHVAAEDGTAGLGYTYAPAAAAAIVTDVLRPVVVDRSVDELRGAWQAMIASVRNAGRPGVAACAISAVDVALWDLKAKIAGQPLFRHLGAHRGSVPVYASGGFTTYSEAELVDQLTGWVELGIPRVKMKVGLDRGGRAETDAQRVRAAREAIGAGVSLYVDANGAYSPKQAVRMAERFADHGVTYFEEPVSSDHLDALAFVRERSPMDIAAGEYGYDPWYFRRMLEAASVDILQADVTRCLGATGFLAAAALAHAFDVPLSAHTAPSIHAHVACAAPGLEDVEWFHDHVRIERLLFDGVLEPVAGTLTPDPVRPGLGLELRRQDAERWAVAA